MAGRLAGALTAIGDGLIGNFDGSGLGFLDGVLQIGQILIDDRHVGEGEHAHVDGPRIGRARDEPSPPCHRLGDRKDVVVFRRIGNTNGGNYRPLWAHSLDPVDMIVSGWFMSLFQAWHPASMMAS